MQPQQIAAGLERAECSALLSEGTSRYVISIDEHRYSQQVRYHFPNGFGASVIQPSLSLGNVDGLFEVAVISPGGRVDYSTPVTGNVLSDLAARDVDRVLVQIMRLPAVR